MQALPTDSSVLLRTAKKAVTTPDRFDVCGCAGDSTGEMLPRRSLMKTVNLRRSIRDPSGRFLSP